MEHIEKCMEGSWESVNHAIGGGIRKWRCSIKSVWYIRYILWGVAWVLPHVRMPWPLHIPVAIVTVACACVGGLGHTPQDIPPPDT